MNVGSLSYGSFQDHPSSTNVLILQMKRIKSIADIEQFFAILSKEVNHFHPDIKFLEYRMEDKVSPRFSPQEAKLRESLLKECFEFCGGSQLSLYDIYHTLFKIDVGTRMADHFPIIFEFLGKRKIPWPIINRKLLQQNLRRTENQKLGSLAFEANFYDIVVQSEKGNPTAQNLLTFFRRLLEELSDNLGEQKELIVDSLYGMMVELDLNYLNYVGELAVLNSLIKSEDRTFIRHEYPLGNGNSSDFGFHNVVSGEIELFEVVNIRPKNFPDTDAQVIQLITQKVLDKIEEKRKNSSGLCFMLVPVLWGTVSQLKTVSNLIVTGHLSLPQNAYQIFCYCHFLNGNEDLELQYFGPLVGINSLL